MVYHTLQLERRVGSYKSYKTALMKGHEWLESLGVERTSSNQLALRGDTSQWGHPT